MIVTYDRQNMFIIQATGFLVKTFFYKNPLEIQRAKMYLRCFEAHFQAATHIYSGSRHYRTFYSCNLCLKAVALVFHSSLTICQKWYSLTMKDILGIFSAFTTLNFRNNLLMDPIS
jgi:hypothetical protein